MISYCTIEVHRPRRLMRKMTQCRQQAVDFLVGSLMPVSGHLVKPVSKVLDLPVHAASMVLITRTLGPSNDFTLLNGCTGKCVRLSRLLAFECTLNHFTFISFHLRVDEVRWSTDGRATRSQELPGCHRASRVDGRDCTHREHRRVCRPSAGPDHRPQHHQEGPRGQDGRQGGRVQSVVSSDPSHEARQPALQAGNAGL